jgi:hypothetical protein
MMTMDRESGVSASSLSPARERIVPIILAPIPATPRNEETTVLRKVLIALVVIFLVYAVINSPTQSGQVTANVWGDIKDGISAVGTFFDTLLSR